MIGLYGLAVWAGLSVGPLIGELLLHASGYTAVWIFAGGAAAARGGDRAPRCPTRSGRSPHAERATR